MTQRCIAGGTWLRTISPKSRSSAPSPRGTTRPPKASAPTSTLSPPWSPHGKCQRTLALALQGIGHSRTEGPQATDVQQGGPDREHSGASAHHLQEAAPVERESYSA